MPPPLYSTAKLATVLKALWPRQWLADVAHALVESTTPWVKNAVIGYFLLQQRVNMREAVIENLKLK